MSRFFINRPIVAIVISIIMVIVGVVSFLSLPVAQYPNIVPPEIAVNTTYVGADALTVEQSVATPIEQQMSGVDHMNYMYSLNASNGTMKLTVDYDIATDPNIDQVLTQMRESQAESQLPSSVRDYGITVAKSTAAPLMVISLSSPSGQFDSKFLANYAYINLNDPIVRVPGIASVTVFGAGQYALRIWVDPNKLAALNITTPEIEQAISTQNTVNPAGQVGGEPIPPGQPFTNTVLGTRTFSNRRAVRQHRDPGGTQRRVRASQRCWARRIRCSDLLDDQHFQRQTRCSACHLSVARLQRRGRREGRQAIDGAAQRTVPFRHELFDRP